MSKRYLISSISGSDLCERDDAQDTGIKESLVCMNDSNPDLNPLCRVTKRMKTSRTYAFNDNAEENDNNYTENIDSSDVIIKSSKSSESNTESKNPIPFANLVNLISFPAEIISNILLLCKQTCTFSYQQCTIVCSVFQKTVNDINKNNFKIPPLKLYIQCKDFNNNENYASSLDIHEELSTALSAVAILNCHRCHERECRGSPISDVCEEIHFCSCFVVDNNINNNNKNINNIEHHSNIPFSQSVIGFQLVNTATYSQSFILDFQENNGEYHEQNEFIVQLTTQELCAGISDSPLAVVTDPDSGVIHFTQQWTSIQRFCVSSHCAFAIEVCAIKSVFQSDSQESNNSENVIEETMVIIKKWSAHCTPSYLLQPLSSLSSRSHLHQTNTITNTTKNNYICNNDNNIANPYPLSHSHVPLLQERPLSVINFDDSINESRCWRNEIPLPINRHRKQEILDAIHNKLLLPFLIICNSNDKNILLQTSSYSNSRINNSNNLIICDDVKKTEQDNKFYIKQCCSREDYPSIQSFIEKRNRSRNVVLKRYYNSYITENNNGSIDSC